MSVVDHQDEHDDGGSNTRCRDDPDTGLDNGGRISTERGRRSCGRREIQRRDVNEGDQQLHQSSPVSQSIQSARESRPSGTRTRSVDG